MKQLIKKNWLFILVLLFSLIIRLWNISFIPPSLFGDELDVGYQAYSILKTGKDYYGNAWPLHFHSIAEYRTPLYLYSSVPTVALFGISPLGIRLPAVIFGVLGILVMYVLVIELQKSQGFGEPKSNNRTLAVFVAAIMAVSPWHLQYSRAGFEATMLLLFIELGIYLFLKSLRTKEHLWLAIMFLILTPWIYSTAKLFTPLLLIFLAINWRKEFTHFSKLSIVKACIVAMLLGLPIAYSTIYGGGAERAEYTSIFTDPTIAPEVGVKRTVDALSRGKLELGASPKFWDRLFHNKFVVMAKSISDNYLLSYSTNFFFVKGDPNLRHSLPHVGQFFKIDALLLLIGLIFFVTSKYDRKIKYLFFFCILAGTIPASLTRDGGMHATRLIIILPWLIFLIAYGGLKILQLYKFIFWAMFCVFVLEFTFYIHSYYIHYPFDSERWWHYGYQQAFSEIQSIDKNYDKVIISMAGEPAWIFFAGWYQYSPDLWQKNFPIGNDIYLNGFGKISHIDKYYFSEVDKKIGLFGIGKYIDNKTLYLANASEIGENLVQNPGRGPNDLKLIKSIPYLSGEPAFYLFTKK